MDNAEFEAALREIRKLTDEAVANIPKRRAPQPNDIGTMPITAGALLRRALRRELMSVAHKGITFTEDKGLLDSLFVVRGTRAQLEVLAELLNDFNRRNP